MEKQELKAELVKRKKAGFEAGDMLAGILPNKIGAAMKGLFETGSLDAAVEALKNRRFDVAATRGWDEAEFTAGGIDISEVDSATLESKIVKNIYFAGEILDVVGERGGYNLGWAWASGLTAGSLA
jgi:predicted flavoprotein YhiN